MDDGAIVISRRLGLLRSSRPAFEPPVPGLLRRTRVRNTLLLIRHCGSPGGPRFPAFKLEIPDAAVRTDFELLHQDGRHYHMSDSSRCWFSFWQHYLNWPSFPPSRPAIGLPFL
jgi:hypothetical protein